jgi:hypothetical protein
MIIYEEESLNRSQMDINVKHVIFKPEENIYFSTYPPPTLIHLSHPFTSSSTPQHRSLLTAVSVTSAPPFQPLRHQLKTIDTFLGPVVNRFTQQTLSTVNRQHFFMNILRIDSFCSRKAHNRMLVFGSISSSTVAILATETSL